VYQYQTDFEMKMDKMNQSIQKGLVERAELPCEIESPIKSMSKADVFRLNLRPDLPMGVGPGR